MTGHAIALYGEKFWDDAQYFPIDTVEARSAKAQPERGSDPFFTKSENLTGRILVKSDAYQPHALRRGDTASLNPSIGNSARTGLAPKGATWTSSRLPPSRRFANGMASSPCQ